MAEVHKAARQNMARKGTAFDTAFQRAQQVRDPSPSSTLSRRWLLNLLKKLAYLRPSAVVGVVLIRHPGYLSAACAVYGSMMKRPCLSCAAH